MTTALMYALGVVLLLVGIALISLLGSIVAERMIASDATDHPIGIKE